MIPSWFEALQRFWLDEGFDPSGKKLLLAVSGGSDSVSLLELFHRRFHNPIHHPMDSQTGSKDRRSWLFAIHVNHQLRPDADLDQKFVEQLCREKNIPLEVEILDPKSRLPGQSVEMWGREKRYEAFARARKKFGADFLFTAHHRDDAVETYCLRIWRGTGFTGMAGIPFRGSGGVMRPLLPVSREALRDWLDDMGVSWREDASNAEVEIPRNWVRHRLLPAWRKQEPDVDDRIFQITRGIAKLLPVWEKWLDNFYPPEEVAEKGGIPMEWLREEGADAAFLRRVLPLLGIPKPVPEVMAEVLRQTRDSHRGVRVRVDEVTLLTEKNGVLVAIRNTFSH